MKGNPEVLTLLNQGLALELTAINQYLAQSKMSKNWGYHKLAAKQFVDYQEERSHAEAIIDRILFLEGTPDIKVGDKIKLGTTIPEQLANDLDLELGAVNFYNEMVAVCSRVKDAGSRELAEFLLRDSEEDVHELEAQLRLLKQIGLENFLIEQIGDPAHGNKDRSR
jgi:bacterioferritin